MSIKTFLLILLLAIVTFGLVGIAVYQYKNTQSNQSQTTSISVPTIPETTLTISSSPTISSITSSYKTDILINTGRNFVTSVQLELSYDPKILNIVDINPGSFFTNPQVTIKNIDTVNGRISFAVSVPKQQGIKYGVAGQGIIAAINFSALAGQKQIPTSIIFLPKTKVSAENFSASALKSTTNASFTLEKPVVASPSAKPTTGFYGDF